MMIHSVSRLLSRGNVVRSVAAVAARSVAPIACVVSAPAPKATYATQPAVTELYKKKREAEVNDAVTSVRELAQERGSFWRQIMETDADFRGKVVLHFSAPTTLADEALRAGISVVLKNKILERETKRPGFRLLVLTPTRERALLLQQNVEAMLALMRKETQKIRDQGILVHDLFEIDGIESQVTLGGHSLEREIRTLDEREPEIIIATPGRLTEHLLNSDYFRNLKYFIVDHADEFFVDIAKAQQQQQSAAAEGTEEKKNKAKRTPVRNAFAKQLNTICSQLNKDRITVCIAEDDVAREQVPLTILLKNLQDTEAAGEGAAAPEPEADFGKLVVTGNSDAAMLAAVSKRGNVKRTVRAASRSSLYDDLQQLVAPRLSQKTVIFAQNGAEGRNIVEELKNRNVLCSFLDGKTAQSIRSATLLYFNEQPNGVLVCTDSFTSAIKPIVNNVIHAQMERDAALSTRSILLRESVLSNDSQSSVSSVLLTSKSSEQQEGQLFEKRE